MARTTITRYIADALKDLSNSNFLTFCHQLRDRREKPRVTYSDVEGKSRLEITDLLVSTFTESRALEVTLDILRQINCNEEAETLNSKTKACVDEGDPAFPKTSTGELEMKPSQEALSHVAGKSPLQPRGPPVKKPEKVMAEAKARVLSEGGDPCKDMLVLSRCTLQFGKYRGQTFKWLLENDVGYAVYVVASHQKEFEHKMSETPLMANKDSLTRYVNAYPEVRCHRGYKRHLQSDQEGKALLGFGRFSTETLQDLYKSKHPRKISYVNFLRTKESTCTPGSKMEVAVRYILRRDQEQAAAGQPVPQGTYRRR